MPRCQLFADRISRRPVLFGTGPVALDDEVVNRSTFVWSQAGQSKPGIRITLSNAEQLAGRQELPLGGSAGLVRLGLVGCPGDLEVLGLGLGRVEIIVQG